MAESTPNDRPPADELADWLKGIEDEAGGEMDEASTKECELTQEERVARITSRLNDQEDRATAAGIRLAEAILGSSSGVDLEEFSNVFGRKYVEPINALLARDNVDSRTWGQTLRDAMEPLKRRENIFQPADEDDFTAEEAERRAAGEDRWIGCRSALLTLSSEKLRQGSIQDGIYFLGQSSVFPQPQPDWYIGKLRSVMEAVSLETAGVEDLDELMKWKDIKWVLDTSLGFQQRGTEGLDEGEPLSDSAWVYQWAQDVEEKRAELEEEQKRQAREQQRREVVEVETRRKFEDAVRCGKENSQTQIRQGLQYPHPPKFADMQVSLISQVEEQINYQEWRKNQGVAGRVALLEQLVYQQDFFDQAVDLLRTDVLYTDEAGTTLSNLEEEEQVQIAQRYLKRELLGQILGTFEALAEADVGFLPVDRRDDLMLRLLAAAGEGDLKEFLTNQQEGDLLQQLFRDEFNEFRKQPDTDGVVHAVVARAFSNNKADRLYQEKHKAWLEEQKKERNLKIHQIEKVGGDLKAVIESSTALSSLKLEGEVALAGLNELRRLERDNFSGEADSVLGYLKITGKKISRRVSVSRAVEQINELERKIPELKEELSGKTVDEENVGQFKEVARLEARLQFLYSLAEKVDFLNQPDNMQVEKRGMFSGKKAYYKREALQTDLEPAAALQIAQFQRFLQQKFSSRGEIERFLRNVEHVESKAAEFVQALTKLEETGGLTAAETADLERLLELAEEQELFDLNGLADQAQRLQTDVNKRVEQEQNKLQGDEDQPAPAANQVVNSLFAEYTGILRGFFNQNDLI
jgi:hypothetical protein